MKATQTPKRHILIVDDHPVMRDGLAQLIHRNLERTACIEAGDAFSAIEIMERVRPELVLLDMAIPGKSGLELIKDILAMYPETLILALSMHDENLYAERVLRAGARGYVMKQQGGQVLMQAIQRVLSGQVYLSEEMSAKLLDLFSGRRRETASPIEGLTDREFEIFQLIGQGRSNQAIADQLHISAKTVEVHRAHIRAKLKIATSAELISRAARWIDKNVVEVVPHEEMAATL